MRKIKVITPDESIPIAFVDAFEIEKNPRIHTFLFGENSEDLKKIAIEHELCINTNAVKTNGVFYMKRLRSEERAEELVINLYARDNQYECFQIGVLSKKFFEPMAGAQVYLKKSDMELPQELDEFWELISKTNPDFDKLENFLLENLPDRKGL